MCSDCFVCIYLVCQCDGLELGMRIRRITVRGVAVSINILIAGSNENKADFKENFRAHSEETVDHL